MFTCYDKFLTSETPSENQTLCNKEVDFEANLADSHVRISAQFLSD